MCRAVLENEEGQAAAKGINDGIVYLMAIPYILFFGVAYFGATAMLPTGHARSTFSASHAERERHSPTKV